MPEEGTTEVWEIVNTTADAHPIHLHLAQFQILSRQGYNTNTYGAAYAASFPGSASCLPATFCPGFGPPLDYRAAQNPLSGGKEGGNPDVTPYLQGPSTPAAANEAGWKDTVIALPGQVTRIAVRWAPTSLPVNTAAASLAFPFDPESDAGFSYVWHCHIIDHEDNEMMRPDVVRRNGLAPAPASRLLKKGIDY
jgi:FtsP/CotA-like multicopper oxidase with cupredoxin domain